MRLSTVAYATCFIGPLRHSYHWRRHISDYLSKTDVQTHAVDPPILPIIVVGSEGRTVWIISWVHTQLRTAHCTGNARCDSQPGPMMLKPCPVEGRRPIGVAYCRTCGSLTRTSGGEEGKRNGLKGEGGEERPVLWSILKLGD